MTDTFSGDRSIDDKDLIESVVEVVVQDCELAREFEVFDLEEGIAPLAPPPTILEIFPVAIDYYTESEL